MSTAIAVTSALARAYRSDTGSNADTLRVVTMQSEYPATPASKLAAGILISDVELAALLGASLQTVRNWRWRGEGPRYVKLGGRMVRYRPDDVHAFIDGNEEAT